MEDEQIEDGDEDCDEDLEDDDDETDEPEEHDSNLSKITFVFCIAFILVVIFFSINTSNGMNINWINIILAVTVGVLQKIIEKTMD